MTISQKSKNIYANFSISWTAYIKTLIIFLILFLIGTSIGKEDTRAGSILCLLGIAIAVFQVLSIRSTLLYTDENGVWVYSGIFPWSKGIRGVKWRDLEDAGFYTGFWSWIFKSYKVRIGHRFTKTSEIVLYHVARGNVAVEHINELHSQFVDLSS